MTDTALKNDQSAVGEVGSTDWIKSEPEDDPEEIEISWESLCKDAKRVKRKREGNWSNQERKDKCPKTYEPQDLPESEQNTLQYLTDDQFIMAYIKEEVVESSITEMPIETTSKQIDTLSSVPEIKDEPKSPPPTVSTKPKIPESASRSHDKASQSLLLLPPSTVKPKRPNVIIKILRTEMKDKPESAPAPSASTESETPQSLSPKPESRVSLLLPPTVKQRQPTVIIKLPKPIPGLPQGLFTPTPTSTGTYACPVCSHKTASIIKLTIHLETHSIATYKEAPFACLICSTIYASSEELSHHLTSECLSVLPQIILQYPVPVATPRIIPIIRDPQSSEAQSLLRVSPPPRPPIAPQKRHICPHCRCEYLTLLGLSRHITKHHNTSTRLIKCAACSDAFNCPSTYRKHYADSHDPLKQYTCRLCKTAFSEEVFLFLHLARRHTGSNMEVCKACSLSFSSRAQGQAHLRYQHMLFHRVRWSFTCQTCGQIVPRKECQREPCEMHQVVSERASNIDDEHYKLAVVIQWGSSKQKVPPDKA